MFAVLRNVPGYTRVRERIYHIVSNNRPYIQRIIGTKPPAEGYYEYELILPKNRYRNKVAKQGRELPRVCIPAAQQCVV